MNAIFNDFVDINNFIAGDEYLYEEKLMPTTEKDVEPILSLYNPLPLCLMMWREMMSANPQRPQTFRVEDRW